MIKIATQVLVKGLTGKKIYDFFLECTDEGYRRWWPGTHLAWRIKKRTPDTVGSVIWFDEYVGRHRISFDAVVREIEPGRRMLVQMRRVVSLPAWLLMELEDVEDGVMVTHTLMAGFRGVGSVLDPLLRLKMSRDFEKAMDDHARTEFLMLRDILS